MELMLGTDAKLIIGCVLPLVASYETGNTVNSIIVGQFTKCPYSKQPDGKKSEGTIKRSECK